VFALQICVDAVLLRFLMTKKIYWAYGRFLSLIYCNQISSHRHGNWGNFLGNKCSWSQAKKFL